MLLWYLGIGVVALVAALGNHWLSAEGRRELRRARFAAIGHRYRGRADRLGSVLVPAIAALAFVAAWPVAIVVYLRQSRIHEVDIVVEEDRGFVVRREQLVERLTVAEVERRELVSDPLKAAPELPFGHLNARWRRFRAEIRRQDELWSFTAPWTESWQKQVMTGYVLVRGGEPGPYIFSTCRQAERSAR
jgi:hypothetical protein